VDEMKVKVGEENSLVLLRLLFRTLVAKQNEEKNTFFFIDHEWPAAIQKTSG